MFRFRWLGKKIFILIYSQTLFNLSVNNEPTVLIGHYTMCFLLYKCKRIQKRLGGKNELKLWVFYLAPFQNKWSTWRAVTLGCWEYLSGLEYWMVFVHLLEEIVQRDYIRYVGYIFMLCVYIHCWVFQEHIQKWEKQKVTLSYFPLNVSK